VRATIITISIPPMFIRGKQIFKKIYESPRVSSRQQSDM
jgi:hypothetical protein